MPDIRTPFNGAPPSPQGGFGAASPLAPLSPDPTEFRVSVDADTGEVMIDMDAEKPSDDEGPETGKGFNENLAERLSEMDLSLVASDIIEGIEADDRSRSQWVENYRKGLELIGARVEDRTGAGQQTRKNVSRVKHPALLWAIVRFQSTALGELLPAAGPVKVSVSKTDAQPDSDERAEALEADLNHYLTVTATEYYPDMDRGLFYLGFGGTIFKKLYHCPLRNRPVSECVYLPDLIVSQDATDLDNAQRITHQIEMQPDVMKRLQASGVYLEVSLAQPTQQGAPGTEQIQRQQARITGIDYQTVRPKDRPHTVWESHLFYDLSSYGLGEKGQEAALPYKITIEKDSRRILEIRRGWKEGDALFRRKRQFVKYSLVPGFGFLDLGFLHLIGNHTKALTALWRIAIDSGMFSAFPGGLYMRGLRIGQNQLTPGPGEFKPVDTHMDDIRKAIMSMPYKDPSPVLLQMMQLLEKQAAEMAGQVTIETGEGRTNTPVGTIMSMIEQQTQVMAAVHKRLHKAQQEEFLLLKELFQEDPQALWRHARSPQRQWQAAQEMAGLDLVPASDPNVPSHIHRIMRATVLNFLVSQYPDLFQRKEVLQYTLKEIGIGDADQFIMDQPPQPQQDPAAMGQAAMVSLKQQDQQLKTMDQRRKAMNETVQAQQQQRLEAAKLADNEKERQAKLAIAKMREDTERLKLAHDSAHRGLDRAARSTVQRTDNQSY